MPSIAVVIMTGNPSPKTAMQSHDLGTIYYMQKPIAKEQFGDTLCSRQLEYWHAHRPCRKTLSGPVQGTR